MKESQLDTRAVRIYRGNFGDTTYKSTINTNFLSIRMKIFIDTLLLSEHQEVKISLISNKKLNEQAFSSVQCLYKCFEFW